MPQQNVFRLVVLCICLSAFATSAVAQQATSRFLEVKIVAPALKGNLLGEAAEQIVNLYLPPGYESNPEKRFPTLYLLHGFLGRSRGWSTGIYQGMNLQTLMDEMIRSGKIREMIVVAPNGWNSYGGAFYSNSSVNGNWEDYIVRDLVGNIDANYRTIAKPQSRGLAGHSMGGFGAIALGMKHPDVFSVIYALAPCCLALEADMSEANPAWHKVLMLNSRDQLNLEPQSFDEFYSLAFVALSAALSPNPEQKPFLADFPYRQGKCPESAPSEKSCLEKYEPAYQQWRAKFPLYMVESHKENLLKLRGIFIDYGEKEEFPHIVLGGQLFSQALAERNIPHAFEIYEDGNHSNLIRRRVETRLLQFFSERLDFTDN